MVFIQPTERGNSTAKACLVLTTGQKEKGSRGGSLRTMGQTCAQLISSYCTSVSVRKYALEDEPKNWHWAYVTMLRGKSVTSKPAYLYKPNAWNRNSLCWHRCYIISCKHTLHYSTVHWYLVCQIQLKRNRVKSSKAVLADGRKFTLLGKKR